MRMVETFTGASGFRAKSMVKEHNTTALETATRANTRITSSMGCS